MITDMFKRPEFAKVKSAPSAYGEGGAALTRNEGDMAIQNISQIFIWDNLAMVGLVPEQVGMYLDGSPRCLAKRAIRHWASSSSNMPRRRGRSPSGGRAASIRARVRNSITRGRCARIVRHAFRIG